MLSCVGSSLAVSFTWRLKSARMRWTVKDPIAMAKAHRITNVSSAETPARRTRIGSRSKVAETRATARRTALASLRTKDVAGSPDRVQEAGLTLGLELAAQVRDEHLDRVGRRERVVAQDLIEQPLPRDHDALVAHQVLEQLELALGQVDRALAAHDLVRVDVQGQVSNAKWGRAAWRSAAQQRAHAREQLLALERLDQVVVGAGVEALDARLERIPRGQDQDRHVVLGAQRLGHLDAVEPGQPEVEDHQVRCERAPVLERSRPVAGRAHLIALHPQ